MASRNLTKKFVDIRNATKANKSLRVSHTESTDDIELLQQGGEWKKDKLGLPPIWVEKVEAIEEDISRIQLKSK